MARERLYATFFFVIVTLSPTLAASDTEPSSEDLFSRIFGSQTEQTVRVAVVRSARLLGEAEIRFADDGPLVERNALTAILSPLVDASVLEDARRRIGTNDFVGIDALAPLGIVLTYHPARVVLELDIAPAALPERTLNAPATTVSPEVLRPATVSGYVNLLGIARASSVDEQSSASAEFEPVVNVRGWVVEGAVLVDSRDDPLYLNHARLVRDVAAQRLRLEVGTPRYSLSPLFSSPVLWGASISRLDDIGRGESLFRDGRVRFVVPEPASIEVFLNDRLFRVYNLEEGPHSLVDVPLGRGDNLVRIDRVGSGGGGRTTLTEEHVPYSPDLLRPGRHLYSMAAGVVRDEVERPFASATHRVGVGPALTVGGDLQATTDRLAVGGHASTASLWGISRLDGAASIGDEVGFAGAVSHLVASLYAQRYPAVEVSLGGESAGYRGVATGGGQGGGVRAGIALNQRLPAGISASLTGLHRWNLSEGEDDETDLRLVASSQSDRGYALTVQIGPTFSSGEVSWSGSIFLRITDPGRRVAASVSHDVAEGPATVSVASIPTQAVGALRWSAEYRGFDRTAGTPVVVGGRAGYDAYRGSIEVAPEFQRTAGADRGEASLSTRFVSALAFADSSFAVSRPIRDGFALFEAQGRIAEYRIPLTGGGGATAALLEGGRAVVPDLRSYDEATVVADGRFLPDGLSVGEERLSFYPGYRQGYRVVMGVEASVYIVGRLVDADGAPIGLQAGEIVGPEGIVVPFFTNGDGRFEITGLVSGEYRLSLYSYPASFSLIAIPGDANGAYPLGDVLFLTQEEW